MTDRFVHATADPPAFCPEYFATVFLVPEPPEAWPRRFAIVTAHNPEGRAAPDDVNEKRAGELEAFLQREGIASFAVTGASPDLSHREAGRGFAVGSLGAAAAISERFRQQAFFLVEDGMLFICIDASGRGWKVAPWRERIVTE